MNLVIDYGNSAAKVGIFDHQSLLEKFVFPDSTSLITFLESKEFDHALISSVNVDTERIRSSIRVSGKLLTLSHELSLPIENRYKTPKTLGVDRLAAVCGAQEIFPLQHSLVIDAGTCITFDFIDKEKVYHGGAISPGLKMRFQAVHTFTARLPLVSAEPHVPLVGDSTESCIRSGIVNGMIAEIDGIIDRYRNDFGEIRVILCGGDTPFFENQLKASIFASPELVLVGLNSILNYNVTLY